MGDMAQAIRTHRIQRITKGGEKQHRARLKTRSQIAKTELYPLCGCQNVPQTVPGNRYAHNETWATNAYRPMGQISSKLDTRPSILHSLCRRLFSTRNGGIPQG